MTTMIMMLILVSTILYICISFSHSNNDNQCNDNNDDNNASNVVLCNIICIYYIYNTIINTFLEFDFVFGI